MDEVRTVTYNYSTFCRLFLLSTTCIISKVHANIIHLHMHINFWHKSFPHRILSAWLYVAARLNVHVHVRMLVGISNILVVVVFGAVQIHNVHKYIRTYLSS